MLLSIDEASDRPIYAQIADAVRRAVARGELCAGDRLPPASEVAIGLGVNKHTVLHAYQQLRDERLIDLRRGRGAVVTRLADEIALLHEDATRIAKRASSLGLSAQTLAALFSDVPAPSVSASPEQPPNTSDSAPQTEGAQRL